MYVKLKELPSSLQAALSRIGYAKPDIEVEARDTYSLSPGTAFEGNRGFCCAVNLATGDSKVAQGAWGGANTFEQTIDHDVTDRPILPNMAVIKGESGGRGMFARISVAPATLALLLPTPKAELTDNQAIVLHCLKAYKSFARRDEAARGGVKSLAYDQVVTELVRTGLAKQSSNGATSITTEGKNALDSLPKGRINGIIHTNYGNY